MTKKKKSDGGVSEVDESFTLKVIDKEEMEYYISDLSNAPRPIPRQNVCAADLKYY